MATYVTLARYTDQGMRGIKESPARVEAIKKLVADHGGEIKAFYLTLGDYDMLAVIDAPNDNVVAKLLLTIGADGNTRTTTFRAYSEEEFRRVVNSLP
jgi:uncharacterized protein with GYD domain